MNTYDESFELEDRILDVTEDNHYWTNRAVTYAALGEGDKLKEAKNELHRISVQRAKLQAKLCPGNSGLTSDMLRPSIPFVYPTEEGWELRIKLTKARHDTAVFSDCSELASTATGPSDAQL